MADVEEHEVLSKSDLAALRADAARFRAIVDAAPMMIDAIRADGTLFLWNAECERQLGWTLEELSKTTDPFARFYPDATLLEQVRADIVAADGRFREYEVRAKDGSVRLQSWANFRLHDGTTVSIGRDLTEVRAREQRLMIAEKLETLGRLTAGIAHDFNNLLTVISMSTELLTRRLEEPTGSKLDDLHEEAANIRWASERGATLVRELLSLTEGRDLEIDTIDLNEVVAVASPVIRRVLPEALELDVVTPSSALWIRADRTVIGQVLLNLVLNARDALAGRGTVKVTLQRRDGPTGGWAQLIVQDSGPGMSPEILERAFEPFFTTKERGRGTGLGLSMVRSQVKQHGGRLSVESILEKGTTFTLAFPLVEGREHAEAAAEAEPVTGSETILIVEDDPLVLGATRSAVESLGYCVFTASDGEDALSQLEVRADIDLVLSDLVMPRLSGRELYDAVQRLPQRLPRFGFTTGYASGADVVEGAVLQKPWSLIALSKFLRERLKD